MRIMFQEEVKRAQMQIPNALATRLYEAPGASLSATEEKGSVMPDDMEV